MRNVNKEQYMEQHTAAMIYFEDDQTHVKYGRYLVFTFATVNPRLASATEILLSCETHAKQLPSGEKVTL